MVNRYTKLRLRRRLKVQKKSLQKAGDTAGENFDKHVLGRWRNLKDVRRFVIGWLVLIALLISGVYLQNRDLARFYQAELPIAGGTFREGVIGNITNMNPIFATSSADGAASKLLFNSLLKYDDKNDLVGDLAESWTVDEEGIVYTVVLRRDVNWHDGYPFNADDVIYTIEAIQHPDTRSFLRTSWQDIEVKKIDEFTVAFVLPNPFTPFPASLASGGILPEHILRDVQPGQLRSLLFNTESPIGTGPFKYNELAYTQEGNALLKLDRYEDYHHGRPLLDKFILQTFDDRDKMAASFVAGEIAAAGGLQTDDRLMIIEDNNSVWYDIPLNNGVFLLFNKSQGILKDRQMRVALSQATDQLGIAEALESRFSTLEGPLLSRQFEYPDGLAQVSYNPKSANKALTKLGWKKRSDGFRYKNNKQLKIQLVTQSSDDYPLVAQTLSHQWQEVGVNLQVLVVEEDSIQDSHIAPHNYQVLLFAVSLGSYPDVFAYWHSSQSGVNGFNLSEYNNFIVDSALEAGRTRLDEELRDAKYQTFLEEWIKDMPAIGLYQASYSYAQRIGVRGFEVERVNTPGDRFNNVHKWQIKTYTGTRQL